ncbi:BrnA antitoxin family protein [Thalassococcus sp. S3]|uniref:BrnA antitoxin family protein n=1 Tax=Thalassococcus sp. S3 TaxID=2017482 RepID=UPI0010247874|nr:BrnA antitoxin family protein [Thalassococcus sp. S3]QBF32125.1 hypothetical protein CFI11_12970 [Thalassococcus sp. S3]
MTKAKPYTDAKGEVRELDDDFFAKAKPGRPALPESQKKKRVNVMLDPDVVERLKTVKGSTSERVNRLLRADLGL